MELEGVIESFASWIQRRVFDPSRPQGPRGKCECRQSVRSMGTGNFSLQVSKSVRVRGSPWVKTDRVRRSDESPPGHVAARTTAPRTPHQDLRRG